MISTINNKRFDVVEYIKKLRSVGVSQEVAEVQGQELEHLIDDVLNQARQDSKEAFDNKELSTKGDIRELKGDIRELELRLQKEIALIEAKLVKWVLGTGAATILALAGLLKYMH